jgi:hypothetical protein
MDVLVITYKPYGFVIYIIPTCSFMEFFSVMGISEYHILGHILLGYSLKFKPET